MPDDPTAASAPAAAPHSAVLEAVWANSPLALLTLEADGTVASINPAGERMMQATAAEIIGERLSERAHRMDRALVRSLVEEAAAGGLPVRREIRFEQPGAPPRVGGMSIASLGPGSNGQSVVVVRDVTAERAPAAVASVAAMVEHEVKRPLALAREALEGLEPRWRDAGGEHARGSLEVALHGIDQASSIVEARLSDISARLKAETDLRASEQRFRALVEQSIDPLFLTDEAGLILEVNPSAALALGLPQEALLGANFIEFAVGPWQHDRRLPWAAVFSAPDLPRTDELTLRRADGTTLPAEIRTVSIGGDGPPRCLSVARDLTERKRQLDATREAHAELERRVQLRTAELVGANAELERASRMKDEFLASMSHELRTPLNAVLGLSEALVEGVYGPLNERQTRGLSSIRESGKHLLELINAVLDITKIAAGRLAVDRVPVDVSDVGLASLRVVREAATRKGLALDLLLDPDVRAVAADPRRLKQVLLNLLSNAVKFTPEGGRVTLAVRPEPDGVNMALQVTDTGIGIAPEDLGRLFRPFVQLDSGLSRRFDGTGLGLALVHALVDLQGGSVRVESVVGRGSSFTVVLPAAEPPAAPRALGMQGRSVPEAPGATGAIASAEAPTARSSGAARGRVLVAEDNDLNFEVLSDFLSAEGWSVTRARDGVEAVDRALADAPDIILMDVQMPRLDGLGATRKIRDAEVGRRVPVIALTALAMPGDRERCLDAGATDYLCKPVRFRELLEMMDARVSTVV